MKRFVLVHYDFGIYLGHCMGLGFFSILDSSGQPSAPTFDTIDDIKKHVESWQTVVPFDTSKIWFAPVEASDGTYATIPDLERAGLSHMLGDMKADALRYTTPAGHA